MPKVRTTLSIDQDVLTAWQKIASIQRISLSSAVNDWLADTKEAAEYMAVQVHAQSQSVRDRVSEITSSLAVVQEGYESLSFLPKGGGGGVKAMAPRRPAPPSCNTGGKLPGKGRGKHG